MFRYRLSTMLATVAVVAFVVFLWLRYVSPNVVGLAVSNGMIIVQMSDEWAQKSYSNDPQLQSTLPSTGGFPLIHDAYVAFSVYVPATAAAIGLFVLGSVYFAVKCLWRRRSSSAG